MRVFNKPKAADVPRRRVARTDDDSVSVGGASFVRNRTITGSSSHKIQSINESGAQLKSPRVHIHHLADQRRRVVSLLAVVLVAALLLYLIVSQFTAQVRVSLKDFPERSVQQAYESSVQGYFDRHPIERLRFLTNTSNLTQYLQLTNPEIRLVSIESSSAFATSDIVLSVRTPITGWTTNGRQQFVDEDGIAFSRNYYAPPKLQIVDQSNLPTTTGSAIASDQFLGFVGRLVGDVHQHGYVVTKVAIPENTTRQIDLSIKGVKYRIKSTVDRSAGEQAEDIVRVIRYLKKHHITPTYIDVRVAGKAYYK